MEKLFSLDTNFVDSYRNRKPPFGFNGLGEMVYLRTYSRMKDTGVQEQWFETVERVVNGTYRMQQRHIDSNDLGWDDQKAQQSAQEMYDRIWNMKFLPPGRGLWAMGSAITEERGMYAALNNCAMVSTSNLKKDLSEPFTFLMDASMLGVGVGFDTKGAGQVKLHTPKEKIDTFVIPDTREGWVESLDLLLLSYFKPNHNTVQFDYSLVRPAGLPIKGFGGVSSGPEPLRKMHDKIREILDKGAAQERTISVTDIVDIMNLIGQCVVAGNVRRTAEIAFGDSKDQEFIDLKNPEINPERNDFNTGWGWTSNNSIFAELGMDYTDVAKRVALNGEPGFAWLDNMKAYGRMLEKPNNKDHKVVGGNPCKPLYSKILTDEGYITFEDALQKDSLNVVLPDGAVAKATKPFKTGENRKVWKITLSNGRYLYGTENHLHRVKTGEWKRIDELEVGDSLDYATPKVFDINVSDVVEYNMGILHGWLWADGYVYNRTDSNSIKAELSIGINEFDCVGMLESITGTKANAHRQKPDTCKTLRVPNHFVCENFDKEDLTWLTKKSPDFKLGFIRAAYTCDGSVRCSGKNAELYSIRRDALETLSYILNEFGVSCGITVHNYAKSYVAKDGLVRNNQTTYKLSVYTGRFAPIGFLSEYKNSRMNNTVSQRNNPITVVDIDPDWSVEDVYDITVHHEDHLFLDSGVVTHNCLEQSLESYELCCLVETFPARHDSLEDYLTTLKYAYLYAKTVTLGKTHWPKTNKVLLRNRRIGLSQSGIQQTIFKIGIEAYKDLCLSGYDTIQHYDKVYSDWFAIPRSIKTTSVKPSGSVSLLAGATPGMHWPESRTYIRRMRLSKNSDLIPSFIEAGYHVEDVVNDTSAVVVEIPVKIEEDIKTVSEVSIWEQFAMAAFLQKYWADNQVSCTVTFDPETESDQIAPALNYFQYQLKGISLLPQFPEGAFPQMPYEACSEEKYQDMLSKIKPINFGQTTEKAESERFCDGDSCIIL